jgi:phosphate transport system substrate-binding protein
LFGGTSPAVHEPAGRLPPAVRKVGAGEHLTEQRGTTLARSRRALGVLGVTAVLAVAVSACGDGGDANGPGSGTGAVTVSGSSTVEPISSLVGEEFDKQNPDVDVRVDGPGTGDGFQLFCNGETDISDASRAIKEEEAKTCADNGIEYVELEVGIDGLSVVTNTGNDAVDCLSFEQLYGLLGPESEGFDNWRDANALVTEIGGEGDLPDADLQITAPGEESGTYDSFIELALGDIAEERVTAGKIDEDAAGTTRPDYSTQANDNAIIDGIEGSPTSLGWVGFAFADQNRERVKLLAVDGGEGCVAPTAETIADGSYPLSRPLFIYVNVAKARENAAVKGYVDFYMSDAGFRAVAEADYVQLTPARWRQTVSKWNSAGG